MSINDPAAAPTTYREPRLQILLNGTIFSCLTASVTQNSHYAADRFHASFALNDPNAPSIADWSSAAPIIADVQVATSKAGGFTSIIIGEIDHVDIDPIAGGVNVEGRDLSGRLIDAKTQETFLNQTSSQIATTLAGRHGLNPVVSSTTTLVARYYQQDYDKVTANEFSRSTNEWDLLTFLAQREGFEVFVQGLDLHFQPAPTLTDNPFVIAVDLTGDVPVMNVTTITMSRALTLAKDIEVDVRSWSTAQGRGFTKIARASGAKSANLGTVSSGKKGAAQRFVFVRPNLTEDQAQKLANSLLADISKHERLVEVTMPGEFALTPRNVVSVQGTGSSWDTTYYIADIVREVTFDGGFTQTMSLKNHSTTSEAASP